MKTSLKLMLLIVPVFFLGCEKDKCRAGAGGNVKFVLSPKHHNTPIPGSKLMVKFSSSNFPGDNAEYDIVTQALPSENSVEISGLKCGDYYIYATGIDSSLSEADKTVKGGIPFSVNADEGTFNIVVPVTEIH